MRPLAPPVLVAAVVAAAAPPAAAQSGYQPPPAVVRGLLDAPTPPGLWVNPTRDHALLVESARFPAVADLARPMLRLAGLRIDPATGGPARPTALTKLTLMSLPDGQQRPVALPPGKVGYPEWSPDGKRFAVTVTTPNAVELWFGSVADGELKQVPGVSLSAALGDPVQWLPGSERLLVQLVPAGRGQPPEKPAAPPGPVVQESAGNAAPARTFQDLLQSPHDEALFDHFATSQLAVIDPDGRRTDVGRPAVFLGARPSPDGAKLLVTRVKRPYSYLHPAWAFPQAVEVWDRAGRVTAAVADRPLQDRVPIEGVPTGPRSVQWVPTRPGEVVWVEALDGGDPRKKVPHRDRLVRQRVTPDGLTPAASLDLEQRFTGATFFPDRLAALVQDYDRERKWVRTFEVDLAAPGGAPRLLFERSTQDRYNDPGTPLTKVLPSGHRVLKVTPDGRLLLAGAGASPAGDRPFLDAFDPRSKQAERRFRSREREYADVLAVLDDDGKRLVVRRESPTTPPNLFLRDGDTESQLTDFRDPTPEFRKVTKKLVTTKRADGVPITFTLYLPPGRKDGEKLPAVVYAYPVEFASADTAGQVSGSPYRFTSFDPARQSHLAFLADGYAVLEVSMPVVGPPGSANDTFIPQLVSNATAAIDKAAEFGVDRDRVGVTGHSYGAFMTANLLAHSDLFRAGIARSGAYNRTLTPFGFQNERRTFWEAPAIYGAMSPFYHADKLKEPILFIHGQADDNSGTFPVQSERMYAAVRGTGGTARLVLLPHESHGYAARESVGHVLAEQLAWFDRHVKHATPRAGR